MRILDAGHHYIVEHLDNDVIRPQFSEIVFVKRIGTGYPGNRGPAHPGTNIQEVLRVLIDRTNYLNWQIHDWRNDMILGLLRLALYLLEDRAAERHNRRLPDHFKTFSNIESIVPCKKCGHIGCEEHLRNDIS